MSVSDDRREFQKRIAKARRHLNAALDLARDVPFTQDDRELLHDTVRQVRDVERTLAEVVEHTDA